MKTSLNIFAVFAIPWILSLSAEEIPTKWDVSIPGPIADGIRSEPLPRPEPIDARVLTSHTRRVDVTEAPEMSCLPPISGTINLTVQLVANPNLPEPPPRLPALPPTDPAVIAKMAELAEKYRGTELIFLSATVYNHHRTLLHIYPNGQHDQKIEAWSNIDFNHFGGFSKFRVKDGEDGTYYDFGLLMGIGSTNTERWTELAAARGIEYNPPEIPNLPDITEHGPAFAVVKGDPASPAMATLEQIHDLYHIEGERMKAAHHAREKALAERRAYLLANPPQPQDVTIRFWNRSTP